MYDLTVNNNYQQDISASDGVIIKNGSNHVFKDQGSLYLTIPGSGQINFIDLGDKKLEGFPIPTQTWGVLVRVHTTEAYYRYEGQGQLTATIDAYGSLQLTTNNGEMITISLPELTIN